MIGSCGGCTSKDPMSTVPKKREKGCAALVARQRIGTSVDRQSIVAGVDDGAADKRCMR